MEAIPTPSKIYFEELDSKSGRLIITPCFPGYGMTIGNSLRRVLLSSLEGSAVTSMKIKGVQHEFSAIKGIKEDVVDVILNLKQAKFKVFSDDPVKVKYSGKVDGKLTLGDFEMTSDVEAVNKDMVVLTAGEKNAEVEIELAVEKGRGYVPVENREGDLSIGQIAIDAVYTPVKRVSFNIENVRVGQRTDFDKITLEIETDGSVSPKEAVESSAKVLVAQFEAVAGVEEALSGTPIEEEPKEEAKGEKNGLADVGLTQRTLNILETAGVESLEDLANKKEDELMAIDGFGKTAFEEVVKVLEENNLKLAE